MRYKLSFFRMFFHGKLQSCSRAYKQNTKPESKRQKVISITECYKDCHLYDKFLLSSAYSTVQPNRNKSNDKRFNNCGYLFFFLKVH